MKILLPTTCIFYALLAIGCSKPVAVEVKDVCSQPPGTNVAFQGYISLPQRIEMIQLTRNGATQAVGLELFVMTKPDATGDAVRSIFWTSDKGEPNKIKPLPPSYSWNDLMVYTSEGQQVGPGNVIRVTGEVKPDAQFHCAVNVSKIDTP